MNIYIKVDHYFHDAKAEAEINRKLDALLRGQQESKNREVHMSVEMDTLIVDVKENTDLDDSIIVLLNGLSAQIEDAAGDKAKALALSAEVKAKSALVREAMLANTPQAPPA